MSGKVKDDATAEAYRAYGRWFDVVSHLLDGDTDEIDAQTWTEWYAKDMPPESAAARYQRFYGREAGRTALSKGTEGKTDV